jgi:hypothetical protein
MKRDNRARPFTGCEPCEDAERSEFPDGVFNTVAVRARVVFASPQAKAIVQSFGDNDDAPDQTRRPPRRMWDATTVNPRDGQTRRHNGESPEHRRQQHVWSQEHGRIVSRNGLLVLLPVGGESRPRPERVQETLEQKLKRLQTELAEAQAMVERMRR